ncbi:MAG: glycosyltransferase family 1 protein [Patescibacteria group bacterium]
MKIAIDARFFGPYGKGLGRYTQKLVEHLEDADQENEYYILLRRDNWADYQPSNPRFHKVEADYRWYSLVEQICMPLKLWSLGVDVVHFTHFNVPILYRRKFVVTIHDLILTKYPTERATTLGPWLYRIKHALYHFVIRSAIKRATRVIAVSEYTKREVVDHFSCPPDKVKVTLEAVDPPTNRQSDDRVLEKYHIRQPYILYVGNAYPHKNCERLIEAFSMLIRESPNLFLVMVGKDDYFYMRIKKLVKEKNLNQSVIFPGFVTDDDLPEIYRHASLYAFPSLCEGFGLPALEACQYNVPVIASNNSSLPEVLGPAAEYFNPEHPDEIYSAMKLVIGQQSRADQLRSQGLGRVALFSWHRMAAATLEIYRSVTAT